MPLAFTITPATGMKRSGDRLSLCPFEKARLCNVHATGCEPVMLGIAFIRYQAFSIDVI
jgi:hypothetical protein